MVTTFKHKPLCYEAEFVDSVGWGELAHGEVPGVQVVARSSAGEDSPIAKVKGFIFEVSSL